MSFKRYRIIFILIFMVLNETFGDQTTNQQQMTNDMENGQSDNKEGRALFPRAEYKNEWLPVGRGDPLKDPTYDYMPPVLDRVRYWAEGTSNKNKNDILLLGVPSKKMSTIKQKEKFSYNPVKRTYYSSPYQSHYSSPQHYQQQQYIPQRLMPPPKHVTDSYPMSSHHFQQLHQPQQQHHGGWKTPGNVYNDARPENSVNHHVRFSRPTFAPSTEFTRPTTTTIFLPTIPLVDRSKEPTSTSPTPSLSAQTSSVNGRPLVNGPDNVYKDTTKPLLQSILQTETASPFTKVPSSVYQIEYTSHNIYNPEAINSMATSSLTTFTPTRPTHRPMSMKTTLKINGPTSPATTTMFEEQKNYVQPEMHPWPVYNLIIEGHSKVKTYGLKHDDGIGDNLPKIRPVQAKDNPIVERVTNDDEGPEFKQAMNKNKSSKKKAENDNKKSTMTSLFSLLDTSFGNFLSDGSDNKVRHESENKPLRNEKEKSERHKARRSIPDEDGNNKQERVFSVSFEVDASEGNEPMTTIYRKGSVISENLWPSQTADTFR